VNRQIRVEDSKNVIVFEPLLTGHVIRRLRSGSVGILKGNQRETLWLINQERIGMGSSNLVAMLVRDPPWTATVQGQKVKGQGHKVTWRMSRQKRYNSANLVGIFDVGVDACGILSSSVGQTNRKYKYGGHPEYKMQ